MAKTGQQLVNEVVGNIGDRQSGFIGTSSTSDACLEAINRALYMIAKRYDPHGLQAKTSTQVDSSTNLYALPTTDTSSNTISVKNILTAVLLPQGETYAHELKRITQQQMDEMERYPESTTTGRPYYYSIFNDQIQVDPWPDKIDTNAAPTTDDWYLLLMKVNCWPQPLLIGSTHVMGIEWEDFIIYQASYWINAKLQQTDDAANYKILADREWKVTVGALADQPDLRQSSSNAQTQGYISADPIHDPFVRRFN